MMSNIQFPAGWTSMRLKYLASYNDEVLSENTDDLTEIDYVEISGVSLSGGVQEVNRMAFFEAPSRARRKVRSGDILVSTVRTYLRAIAAVDKASEDLIASTGFCVIRPQVGVDSSFLGWAAKSEPFVSEVVARSVGVSYPAINASELANIEVPLPPLETQNRIAQFLDEKTARIDGLIEKKRALLDRLAEKRQALITRAVTKGLNPDAPMKPSGIDWLGDIPAHWEVLPLKRRIIKIEQGWSPSAEARLAGVDEWGVLKSGCVNEGSFDETSHKALPVHLDPKKELEVKVNDILMCRASGSLRFIGSVALINKVRPNLMFSDKTYRLELDERCTDKHFFVYSMAAKHLREQIVLSVSGAEGLANNISQSSVGRYLHCFPPLQEQHEIAKFVMEMNIQAEYVKGAIGTSLRQLDEYRSALVASSVTGNYEALA